MKHRYWIWENDGLDSDVCDDWVNRYSQKLPEGVIARIGGDRQDNAFQDTSIRRSTVTFATDPDVIDTMYEFAKIANRQAFGFNISDQIECQFAEYTGSQKGFYDLHEDSFCGSQDCAFERKISISVLLTDPCEFEGGILSLGLENLPLKKGSVVAFPSFLAHKVSPVISGTRHAMVAWIEGPQWV